MSSRGEVMMPVLNFRRFFGPFPHPRFVGRPGVLSDSGNPSGHLPGNPESGRRGARRRARRGDGTWPGEAELRLGVLHPVAGAPALRPGDPRPDRRRLPKSASSERADRWYKGERAPSAATRSARSSGASTSPSLMKPRSRADGGMGGGRLRKPSRRCSSHALPRLLELPHGRVLPGLSIRTSSWTIRSIGAERRENVP